MMTLSPIFVLGTAVCTKAFSTSKDITSLCCFASITPVIKIDSVAAVELVAPVDSIVQVVRIVCYVNGAPGFVSQPQVANGAFELFMHIFGDAGIAARSALGVAELPLNSPVEVELTVEIA